MEMQKLLGVSSVNVYKLSTSRKIQSILEYYAHQGYVTIHDHRQISGYMHRIPGAMAMNDCVYRNMYKCRKIMILDFDEYIVPQNYSVTLPIFTRWLAKQNKVPYDGTHFTFLNTIFYTDNPLRERSKSSQFPIFKYVYKTKPQRFPGGVKTIVDPVHCKHTTLHYCKHDWSGRRLDVAPSIGKLHHYKTCKDNWWKKHLNFTSCEEAFRFTVRDPVMARYEDIVLDNVKEVNRNLNATRG
jgi:hypothetical protein